MTASAREILSPPTVVIGLVGSTLDGGRTQARWERWRPSVALCQHSDLIVSRFELLYQPRFEEHARQVSDDISRVSPETLVRLVPLELEDPWNLEQVYASLHDFAHTYPFRTENEDYLVHITTGTHVAQICMFLLVESRDIPARLIQTSPAVGEDASEGSFTIIDLDLSRYDQIARRFAQRRSAGLSVLKAGIETRNERFNLLISQIEHVAGVSRAPMLITGPTGAGKSQLASRIYELKKSRRLVTGEFVEVNCATLRGDAAMSALFGHARGAFTGAQEARAGLLRKADGGLLFLDEIGELGLDEQAMLLRAIEQKAFLPLGSDRTVLSDFQLIAGTNRDLRQRVVEGRFREDLLARINLWTFELPGLRERREDIEPNLTFETETVSQTLGTRITFNREARERFLAFACSADASWNGNFRDLNAAVIRMATFAQGGRITLSEVEDEMRRLRSGWAYGSNERALPATTNTLAETSLTLVREEVPFERIRRLLGTEALEAMDQFDRVQLDEVLRVCATCATVSAAGRVLFAGSRARRSSVNDADRLRKYLTRFDLTWEQVRAPVTR